jgi:hypothetical protein
MHPPQFLALAFIFAFTLGNLFWLEPLTSANMFKRFRLEAEGQQSSDEMKALRKNFGALHGLSSIFNFGALFCTVNHGMWLASKLAIGA